MMIFPLPEEDQWFAVVGEPDPEDSVIRILTASSVWTLVFNGFGDATYIRRPRQRTGAREADHERLEDGGQHILLDAFWLQNSEGSLRLRIITEPDKVSGISVTTGFVEAVSGCRTARGLGVPTKIPDEFWAETSVIPGAEEPSSKRISVSESEL